MPALTTEDKLEYLISALQYASELPIDFHKVAKDHKIVNANKAQIKFKKIIDETGKFKLTAGKVIALDTKAVSVATVKKDASATSVEKPKGRPKKAVQPSHKKRKIEEIVTVDEADSDEEDLD